MIVKVAEYARTNSSDQVQDRTQAVVEIAKAMRLFSTEGADEDVKDTDISQILMGRE